MTNSSPELSDSLSDPEIGGSFGDAQFFVDITSPKKNHLINLSKLPTPITQTWEFTIPILHWILHLFHIEGGLLITFHITILAH